VRARCTTVPESVVESQMYASAVLLWHLSVFLGLVVSMYLQVQPPVWYR
jgi:hypothetical protein